MTTALLSVSDKTGIVEFAQALHARGIRLLSTGGTARLLAQNDLPVTEVSEITAFRDHRPLDGGGLTGWISRAATWPAGSR